MRAAIRSYDSYEIEDLQTDKPDDPLIFAVSINFEIGPADSVGADNFRITVASAEFLRHQYPGDDCYFLRHYLLVKEYNFSRILALMTNYVNSLEAETWEQLAEKIGRVALWEFEDYHP